MYVVVCKIDHCIHIHWCIVMGLGHNDPWVESHMWPQQTWSQRSSRVNDLWFKFLEKRVSVSTYFDVFSNLLNITMIAKVCDRESRRDSWFENRLVYQCWRNLGLKTVSESFISCLKHEKLINFCLWGLFGFSGNFSQSPFWHHSQWGLKGAQKFKFPPPPPSKI